MNPDLRAQIALLVDIQAIDSQARQFQRQRDGVIGRLASLDERLRQAEERLAQDGAAIATWKKQYRALEGESQQQLAKISRSREKLMAVKTNKEYTLSLKEIEDLQATASGIDDRMLEILEALDAAEKDQALRRGELAVLSQAVAREKADIAAEAEDARRQQETLMAEVETCWRKVNPEMLVTFRSARARQPKGIAVAAVSDAVCRGCNMNIPPQLYNELQRWDSIKYCPNCQRIIYWEMDDQRPEPTERSLGR